MSSNFDSPNRKTNPKESATKLKKDGSRDNVMPRREFLKMLWFAGVVATSATLAGAMGVHAKEAPRLEGEKILELHNVKIVVSLSKNTVTMIDYFGEQFEFKTSPALPGYKTPKGHYKVWWDVFNLPKYQQYWNIEMNYGGKYLVSGFVPVIRLVKDSAGNSVYDPDTVKSGNLPFGFHGVPRSMSYRDNRANFSDDPNSKLYPRDEVLGESHGCKRLNQKDIRRLFLKMQFVNLINQQVDMHPNLNTPILVTMPDGTTKLVARKPISVDINVVD